MKTNMKRKKIEEKLNVEKSDTEYCIECGEVLEDFSVDDNSKDIKAVKENFENCKHTRKFKGDVCSKLYIVSENDVSEDS